MKPRGQTFCQAHQLDIALAFALKTLAGGYPVQIPVDVDLEHHARMMERAPRERWRGNVEARFRKVQFVHEDVYDPDWVA